jgi:hypothetical protein
MPCGLFWALVDNGRSVVKTIVIVKRVKNLFMVCISVTPYVVFEWS